MPFGRQKPKDPSKDKSKPPQKKKQDKQQPAALKAETKYTSGNDDPGTWGTFATGNEGDKESKRRPSSTSGASVGHGETQFGPNVLFEQDHVTPHPESTPPPHEKKKVTFKSKLAKSFGFGKGNKSNHEEDEEPQTHLSPDSHVTDETFGFDEQSLESGSGLQETEDHPLAPNRYPTLDSYIEPQEETGGGITPKVEKPIHVSPPHQRSASLSGVPTRSSTKRRDDQSFTNESKSTKQKTAKKDSASQSQSTEKIDHTVLRNKIAEIRKLKTEVTEKDTELKTLSEEVGNLKTKLDKRDLEHDKHLQTRLAEVNKKLEAKETSLQNALHQIETLEQAAADAVTKTRDQYEEKLAKAKDEWEKQLSIKQEAAMNAMQLCVTKEAEVKSLKEQLEDKELESQKELEQQKQRLKEAHKQQLAQCQGELTQTVEDLRHQLANSQSQLEEITKKSEMEAEGKANRQAEHSKSVEELQQQLTDTQSQLEETKNKLEVEAKCKNEHIEKVGDLQQQLTEVQSQVKDLEQSHQTELEAKTKQIEADILAKFENEKQQLILKHEDKVKRLETQLDEKGNEMDSLQKKLTEKNTRELNDEAKPQVDETQARLKAEFEAQITEKVQQNEALKTENQGLTEEIERLQQEAQRKDVQLAADNVVVEAKLKVELPEGQQSVDELRAEIESQVEKQHREEVAKAVQDALSEQADQLKELTQKLESAGKESDLRVENLKKQHDENVKSTFQRHRAEINRLQQQRQETARKLEQNYMAKLDEKTKDAEQAIIELNNRLRQAQGELKHSQEQYGQLKVLAEAKKQLTGASRGEDESFPSSLVDASKQIAGFINPEAFIETAVVQKLEYNRTLQIKQAIGLPETKKPRYYVFATFSAHHLNQSVLLDYTTDPPQTGAEAIVHEANVTEVSLQDVTNDDDDDEHFEDAPSSLPLLTTAGAQTGHTDSLESNMTDAEKLKKSEQDAEDLRDQLETLTHRVQDLETAAKDKHELEIQVQSLEEKLREAKDMIKEMEETKAELVQAVELTKHDGPKAIDEGTDASAKVKHMKDMYLAVTDRMVEKEEKYKKRCQDLRDKIDDRDKQLKELRAGVGLVGPFAVEPSVDPTPGGHVEQVIRDKEEKIVVRETKVKSLEEKASQGQRVGFQEHSKEQSRLIFHLRQENKQLQEFKDSLEDELHALRGEVQGQRSNQSGTPPKAKLFDKLAHADCQAKIEKLQAEVEEWKTDAERLDAKLKSQVNASEKTDKGIEIVQDDKEVHIKYLEKRLTEHQEEIVKLKERLKEVKVERDNLQQQNVALFAVKSDLKGKLSQVDQLKAQVSATRDTATSFADQVAARTMEASNLKEQKEALQKEIDDLKGELEARKLEAQDYKEGFNLERSDRENMAGRIDDERAKLSVQLQLLRETLEAVNKQFEAEQQKNTTLEVEKAHLEVELATQEAKVNELEDSLEACKGQLRHHEQLYQSKKKEFEEDRKVKTEMIQQYRQKQQDSEVLFQRRQAELEAEAKRLKTQAEKAQTELLEKADLATAQKMSLQEQYDHVQSQYKLKEKQLEIMASEKENLEEQTGRMRSHCTAVQLELEDSRRQLEVTIKDTSTLSDEVLAKTQQVKQYKKQTDSYKIRLEETAAKLEETAARQEETVAKLNEAQRKLQHFQEQIKRMEEDHQYQIEVVKAQLVSDKLTAEGERAIAQRQVADLQFELRQWKTEKISEGHVSEALRIESQKREEAEQKFEAAQKKCNLLFDKCDYQFKAIEVLQRALTDNGVQPPRIDVGRISTSLQNVQPASTGQPRQQATPPVSQHSSQYDQHAGYSPPQQPASPYQPHGQQLDPSRPIRAVAPSTHPSQPQYSQQPHPPVVHGTAAPMSNQGQHQHAPFNQQNVSVSDPTQGMRQAPHKSMTAPQNPPYDQQTYGQDHHALSGVIAQDRNLPQHQNQQALRRIQEDGGEYLHGRDQYRGEQGQYVQMDQPMGRQGGQQMMRPQARGQGGSPRSSPASRSPKSRHGYPGGEVTMTSQGYSQPPSGTTNDGEEHPYVNLKYPPKGPAQPQPSEDNRGQVQGYPLNQQYPPTSQPYPPTSQPSQQYPPISPGYQPNPRQLPTNQGYHGNQGYVQNQQFPPTNQPHNIPNQPWGQNQGHPPNQRQPPATRQPYTPPNQGQVEGGDQSHGAGVRNPNPSPTPRARVGSHGAYIGGGTANPPYDARQGQGSHPVPAPRGGRKSDPTPPTGQSDKQPAQPEKREKEDTAVQENVLLQGIDDDIHQAAEEVQKEDDDNEESLSEVPLDPNLVCPLCMKQFRLGQIQKYKRHVGKCQGQ